jgi:hypothetical protein
MEQTMSETTKAINVDVIPWEALDATWGVAIDLPSGQRTAYAVGEKAVAKIEARRIEEGKPPLWGPWAGRELKHHDTRGSFEPRD